jgi:lipoprotein-releasing system permease protein
LNLSYFIARRVAFNRQRSFSRFIIRLAIAATIISVAAMIVTVAFTNGFQQTISKKIFSFWGHIRLQHYEPNKVSIAEEQAIKKNDTVYRIASQNPDVRTISTFATKNAILKTNSTIDGVLFKGVEKEYDFPHLQQFLKRGRWMKYPDSGYSTDIVLSESIANELELQLNQPVLIYFIQSDGSPPRARKLNLCGIYKTGIEEYDKLIALGDLRLIQRLNGWNADEIGGYEIFLNDYRKLDSVNESIFYALPDKWNSLSIRDIYPNIFDWLNLQDKTVSIVINIMIIVAILNLVTCLIILVLERTRMVGVLKALGAANPVIQRIFLLHGAIITGMGILGGNILAIGLCLLQQRYGFIKLPEDMYYIKQAEVALVWWQVVAIDLGTFVVCFLVLFVPTFIIRKIQPVAAIRFQ